MKNQTNGDKKSKLDAKLIEKFFTERELVVEYDKREDSTEESAKAWFEEVKKAIDLLPPYEHGNMGPFPHEATGDAWFFRGQKDASFAFNSTLYRRLLHASDDNLLAKRPSEHEKAMLKAELSLLKIAREIGIGRGLTALEILTLLQHHGSPTRLIDITSDWKVALFFACESDDDRDGRLFLIKINTYRWRKFPQEHELTERNAHPIWHDYPNTFPKGSGMHKKYSWLSGTWPVLLPFSDPRMISQRGFFLVGGVPSPKDAGKLYTSKCPHCSKKVCFCPDSEVIPRSEMLRIGKTRRIDPHLNTSEFRTVTSLTIQFAANRTFLNEITKERTSNWTAVGYSIRIPKEYKRTLREILHREGIHNDSIYPPLRETARLFEHVVDESLKQ